MHLSTREEETPDMASDNPLQEPAFVVPSLVGVGTKLRIGHVAC